MISTTEQTETAPETKASKKAAAGARRANVTPAKGKAGKKATPAKKAPKSAKKATGARDGSTNGGKVSSLADRGRQRNQ